MRTMSSDTCGRPLRRVALLGAVLAIAACQNDSSSGAPGGTTPVAPAAQYSVQVTVSGLNGSGLTLQNNGAGDIAVTANGSVTFAAPQLSGTPYAVTVSAQPAGPEQTCSVANGSGTIGSANVTNVMITCVDDYVPSYAPSAKGDPQGAATTQMIDATGGSLSSADGRITLVIPAGALASTTAISIQPITNTAPNGSGFGYRLEPEGTTFAVPVTLTFNLSATEALAIDSTFVATQHADGFWYSQPHQQRDASAQTVGVSTTHFSDWAVIPMVVLTPPALDQVPPVWPRVRTGGTLSLTAEYVFVDLKDNSLIDPNNELQVPSAKTLTNQPHLWEVNDVVGGNDTVGKIEDPGAFYAPAAVPTPNPVTVKLTAQLDKTRAIAVDQVIIFAQEIWSGTTDITQIDGTKIHSEVTFVSKDNSNLSPPTRVDFTVQSGQVRVTIPPTNSAGCTQSVDKDTHDIAPDDGSLSVTYATDTHNAQVVGGGTTAWGVLMTVACDNGIQNVQTTLAAPWWPINSANPMQSFPATNGVLDATVGDLSATGTVHLVRQ